MSYKHELEKYEAEIKRKAVEANAEQAIFMWLTSHPEIRNCQAAREICRNFFENIEEIDQDALQWAFQNGSLHDQLAPCVLNNSESKEYYCKEILSIRKNQMSEISYRSFAPHFRARSRFRTNAELAAELRALQLNQQLRQTPKEELKKIVKGASPQAPALPDFWSAELIKECDSDSLRKLIKRFGLAEINKRLNSL